MDDSKIVAAMDEAKEESRTIGIQLLEMEKLQQRKVQLDTFIAQCQLLLGRIEEHTGEALFELPQAEVKASAFQRVKESENGANWKKARAIFIEMNNPPMRLSQLVQEFQKRGFPLSEKNAKEVMRSTVRGKPDIFAYETDTYTYRLKDYSVVEPSPAEQ